MIDPAILFFAVVIAAMLGYAFGCRNADRQCLRTVLRVLAQEKASSMRDAEGPARHDGCAFVEAIDA